MSDTGPSRDEEPDWDLLPYDAEGFFGLSGQFDLRDLKRSYNRLIRRYKPERAPAEFQRIRAAYEQLNDRLRYNLPSPQRHPPDHPHPLPQPGEPTNETPSPDPPETSAEESQPASAWQPPAWQLPTTTETFATRLAQSSPQALYDELQRQANRSPEDYIALALLADIVAAPAAPGHAGTFCDWLLAGLETQPRDWGLVNLLREYLTEDATLAELPARLRQVVALIPAERFLYATERAWDRLLREAEFKEFQDCLEHCEQRLGRARDQSQLTFLIHLLKRGVWKGEMPFLETLRERVEEHYHQLEGWAQDEYEVASWLVEYRERRGEFIKLGACCRRVDQAIQDWCLLAEHEGDLSVLECQYYLSAHGEALLQELPEETPALEFVLVPWNRIVADVLDRLDSPPELDASFQAEQVHDFVLRVHRRHLHSLQRGIGTVILFGGMAVALLTLVAVGALLVRGAIRLGDVNGLGQAGLDGLAAIGALVAGAGALFAMFLAFRQFWAFQYDDVRRDLVKLIRVLPLRVKAVARQIRFFDGKEFDNGHTLDDVDVILAGMLDDPAIELFSLAQVTLRSAAPIEVIEASEAEASSQSPRPPDRPVRRPLA